MEEDHRGIGHCLVIRASTIKSYVRRGMDIYILFRFQNRKSAAIIAYPEWHIFEMHRFKASFRALQLFCYAHLGFY